MRSDAADQLDAKLLTVAEAAALLGVSRGTILNRFRAGALRGLRVGKVVRLVAADVRRLVGCVRFRL